MTAADFPVLELAGETCARCDTDMVITYDALRRPRKRCPRCDGVSRKAPPNADTVLVPLVLGTALPPIEPGQLRCQGCARGLDNGARFCVRCARPIYKPKLCKEPSCRKQFTPTAPRAEFCEDCR